jgi:hypothetical protein
MFYTYLMGWSKQNKFYYGVRYSKHAKIEDIGTTYFSSSKYVKEHIELFGIPDIIQIRKIFDNKEKALIWETKILKRMKVVEDIIFLNRWDNNMVPLKENGPYPFEFENIQKKINDIFFKKYGGKGSKSEIIKLKIYDTNNKKYGVHHTINVDVVKNAREKSILEKYGTDNPFKNNDKLKETMIERYGVDNMMKISHVREQHKKTMSEKNWTERNEKTKITMLEKYGKTNILNNQEIREKNERICHLCENIKKYNAGNFSKHMIKSHGWSKKNIKEYKYENKKNPN